MKYVAISPTDVPINRTQRPLEQFPLIGSGNRSLTLNSTEERQSVRTCTNRVLPNPWSIMCRYVHTSEESILVCMCHDDKPKNTLLKAPVVQCHGVLEYTTYMHKTLHVCTIRNGRGPVLTSEASFIGWDCCFSTSTTLIASATGY